MNATRAYWYKPSRALSVGLVSCLIRVAIKLTVGIIAATPLLTGDGFHNIGDAGYIFGAILIMIIMRWKGDVMHAGENMGVMFQFGVAWMLAGLGVVIGYYSLLGLFPCLSCEHSLHSIWLFSVLPYAVPRTVEAGSYGMIMGTIGISILISLVTSEYHMRAGKASNYGMLITIGKETRSDMWVEGSILAGFLGEYFWNAPWIEYAFGLIVMFLILRTAWELFWEANDTFLQVSIGSEFVEGITALVNSTYGIERIVKLETYPVLQAARVKVWVATRGGAEANEDIRSALQNKIHAYAAENGFSECRPDIFFTMPDNEWHRITFAVVKHGKECFVASGIAQATHLRVCGVKHGEVVSGEDIAVPETKEALIALLQKKHVSIYRAWSEGIALQEMLAKAKIVYLETPTIIPPG